MKKRLLSLFLTFAMMWSLLPAMVFAGEGEVVYISAAHEGKYLNGLAYTAVPLSALEAINLADYNLGDFVYDADGDETAEITAIHLAIYAHETLYGLEWTDGIISGWAGSSYFSGGLFGWDENMRYNFNGEYPADENGWGITTDQLVLSAGDYLDFSHYNSWAAPMDVNTGFQYFIQGDEITHAYTVEAGQPLTAKLIRANSDIYAGTGTVHYESAGHTVYYSTHWYDASAASVTTNDAGEAEITFAEAGTYYLWADGGYGAEPDWMTGEPCIVSSPAYAKVIVTGSTIPEPDPEPATYTVTLPEGEGYTATASDGSVSPVAEGGSYSFTVAITDGYQAGADFAVKSNGVTLTTVDGIYTISNITADQSVTVTGVVEQPETPSTTRQEIMAKTKAYLIAQAEDTAPVVDTFKGEWMVLGLTRAGVGTDSLFFDAYYDNAKAYVAANIDNNGRLHEQKSTDNSRLILALTALGKDVTNIAGHNLLSGLSDLEYVKNQGINGPIFALIALDAYDYVPHANATATREVLIDYILGKELSGGGWALSGQTPDDMTPMAVQALAPYYDTNTAVKTAVDKALTVMATMTATTETYAQIIVARSALGLDSADALDKMLAFTLEDGSFEKASGSGANQMSTEQAFYAMVAYSRYLAGENALYDMTDVPVQPEQPASAEAVKAAMQALEVEQADKATYTAIQKVLDAYSKLTREEKAAIADTYEDFLDKEEDFEDLLEDAIDDAKLDLEDLYEDLDSDEYTEESWDEIRSLYRDCRDAMKKARYIEELEELLMQFEEDVDNILVGAMEVAFRLIGDWKHDGGVSDHEEYVTWIKTTEYILPAESTVYDLLMEALEEYDLSQKGASKNYVESIQAPDVLGGYWLGEFDNGPNSGWMYTINGDHPGTGLKDHELEDGDEVIWHYVDDYAQEQRKPSSKYYERWLEADDIAPETYIKRNLDKIVTVEGKGEVKPELKTSHIGKDVKFTFVPAEGWVIKAVYVDGKDKGVVETFTYKKLAMDARIEVIFAQATETEVPLPFADVQSDDWFYEDVRFAVQSGLFNGIDAYTFSPNTSMTRAMLVTVLYRLDGQPAVTGGSSFADVAAGQWYTDAVIWATRNDIVNGLGNGKFGTNDHVTREQMAAILYRYAQACGYDAIARADLGGYTDAAKISSYAQDAMSWANAMGLINGRTATTLAPTGTATRAEVAAIFHRFAENIAK